MTALSGDSALSLEKICAVLQIISSVSADLTLDEILNNIARQVVEAMAIDSCAISLWDVANDAVIVMADFIAPSVTVPEDDIDDLGLPYPLSNYPATARVLNEQAPLIVRVDDPATDETERKLLESFAWSVVLLVPMIFKGRTVGLMELYLDDPRKDAFSEEDIYLCQVLANQAAIALQNARLVAELKTQQEELRRLSLQLVNAQEIEARRIARELHDQFGQNLIALRINLDMVKHHLPAATSLRLTQSLHEAQNLAVQTQEMARYLWQKLRPPVLDELGLVSALFWEIDRYEQRTGLHVDFQVNLAHLALGPELDITIYRIIVEALTNVARHAAAKKVWVRLHKENGSVLISVKDDGLGFDAANWPKENGNRNNLGLMGIQERVKLFNGQLQVKSKKETGTEITVLLPNQQ